MAWWSHSSVDAKCEKLPEKKHSQKHYMGVIDGCWRDVNLPVPRLNAGGGGIMLVWS